MQVILNVGFTVLGSPEFKKWRPRSLRTLGSLFYLTTLCCHLLSVYSFNTAHSADPTKRSEVTMENDAR